MKATIFVEKGSEKGNFSCFVVEDMGWFGLNGFGETAKAAIEDLYATEKEMREVAAEEGKAFPEHIDYTLTFDLGSFFDYYDFLNINGVARRAGINPSLMRQYVMGKYTPAPQRREHINNVLKEIAQEIQGAAIAAAPAIS